MAINLLFNFSINSKRRVAIAGIELDATIREEHSKKNVVTDHAIEDGSMVSDHIYSEPDTLIIEGEISDTPIAIFGGLMGLSSRRSIDAYEELVALRNNRELVTVVTGLEIYSDMAITSLDCPRDQKTGRRLLFTAELKKVRKVSTQLVTIPASKVSEAQKRRAPSTINAGRQSTSSMSGKSVKEPTGS